MEEGILGVTPATHLPTSRHTWFSNTEIAAVLTAYSRLPGWISEEHQHQPPSGSIFIFDREKTKFRKDGYEWEKRKDGRSLREDHAKLKINKQHAIYGCYAHLDKRPHFHRRCYWLLERPRVVMVHYLDLEHEATISGMVGCDGSAAITDPVTIHTPQKPPLNQFHQLHQQLFHHQQLQLQFQQQIQEQHRMPVIAEPFIPQHLQYPSGYYFGRPQSYGSHEALSSSPAPELVRQEELYSRQFEFGTAETRNQEGYFTADTMVGDPPELGPLESRATGGVSYAIDEMLEFDGDNVSSLQENYDMTSQPIKTDQNAVFELKLVEYSPKTAPSQGGQQVLLVGDWGGEDEVHTCYFGTVPIVTQYVQQGVLSVVSPELPAGEIYICVVSNLRGISTNAMPFEVSPPLVMPANSEKEQVKDKGWSLHAVRWQDFLDEMASLRLKHAEEANEAVINRREADAVRSRNRQQEYAAARVIQHAYRKYIESQSGKLREMAEDPEETDDVDETIDVDVDDRHGGGSAGGRYWAQRQEAAAVKIQSRYRDYSKKIRFKREHEAQIEKEHEAAQTIQRWVRKSRPKSGLSEVGSRSRTSSASSSKSSRSRSNSFEGLTDHHKQAARTILRFLQRARQRKGLMKPNAAFGDKA